MLDEQKSRGWEFRGIARAGEASSTAPRALFIIAVSSRERSPLRAEVAELADAQASGACGSKIVKVQILSSAPFDSPRLQRGSLMASRDPFARQVECPERA